MDREGDEQSTERRHQMESQTHSGDGQRGDAGQAENPQQESRHNSQRTVQRDPGQPCERVFDLNELLKELEREQLGSSIIERAFYPAPLTVPPRERRQNGLRGQCWLGLVQQALPRLMRSWPPKASTQKFFASTRTEGWRKSRPKKNPLLPSLLPSSNSNRWGSTTTRCFTARPKLHTLIIQMNSPKPSQAEAPSETKEAAEKLLLRWRNTADAVIKRVELTESEQRNFLTELLNGEPTLKQARELLEEAKERAMPQKRKAAYKPGERISINVTPWLVEGILREGVNNLLVALPKTGKSALSGAIVGALGKGLGSFLGRKIDGDCPEVHLVWPDMPPEDAVYILEREGLWEGLGVVSLVRQRPRQRDHWRAKGANRGTRHSGPRCA